MFETLAYAGFASFALVLAIGELIDIRKGR